VRNSFVNEQGEQLQPGGMTGHVNYAEQPGIGTHLQQDYRAAAALNGLSQKQSQIYSERKLLIASLFDHQFNFFLIVFQHFSGDGAKISAIEFFKLCKLCKIYPVVITFEDLKKIVLKNKEFWLHH